MSAPFFFRCINPACGREYDAVEKIYECPACRDLLDLVYDFPDFDPTELKRTFRRRRQSNLPLDQSGVWRFREFLPFEPADYELAVTFGEGNTPLVDAPGAARYAGLDELKIKHLGWNPTGSFKDYGMTVGVTQARKLGMEAVACASTGNTSASMAAYSARAGLKGIVFIPAGQIAFGKLAQTMEYGAQTIQIEGDFDLAMKLVRELAECTDIYLLNSINPFRVEGQKTVAFELLDQLDWQVPDRIVLPGGNLGHSASLGKALWELKDLGLIDCIPRVTIIQASGASPLHSMLASGLETLRPFAPARTHATAIKIGSPVSWKKALRSLEISDGWCDAVNEQEIADAKAVLGRDGLGCEPASATTVAGLKKLLEVPHDEDSVTIHPGEKVVAILTGHQLKDPDYTVNYHFGRLELNGVEGGKRKIESTFGNPPVQVAADLEKIRELIEL
jgi:threonine synthase